VGEDPGKGPQARRLELGIVRDLDDGHGLTLRRAHRETASRA
jgi:hypothetical protein